MKKLNKIFGFTLVEILVVISIIGILSAVLAGGYVNSQKSSRDAVRKIQLKSISDALNSYYADYGRYPLADGPTGINQIIEAQGEFSANGNIYIKKMPKETATGVSQISYVVGPSPYKSFRLYTNLENPEDKACFKGSDCDTYSTSNDCCYIITSSNVGITGTMP